MQTRQWESLPLDDSRSGSRSPATELLPMSQTWVGRAPRRGAVQGGNRSWRCKQCRLTTTSTLRPDSQMCERRHSTPSTSNGDNSSKSEALHRELLMEGGKRVEIGMDEGGAKSSAGGIR